MARTGTSMTSGIFHHHGVWCGECRPGDERNPKGFFEHTAIKKLLKKFYGVDLQEVKRPIPGFRREVERILSSEGYVDGPWLVKHSAVYYKTWHEFNPKYVLVRRPFDATVESTRELHQGRFPEAQRKQIIKLHNDVMDEIAGVNVYTQDLIQGDYSSIKKAIEYCGLDYDESVVKEFIEPGYWHHVS